jgi:retinol-binding protein 3
MRKLNGAIPKVEILDGNVGYTRVNGVPPVETARSAVAAAFAFLHNTDALIIDNRGNGGGDPNTVAVYVTYLSEGKPYIVNTFHWRAGDRVEEFKTTDLGELAYGAHKPVFVLASPATFSGGEELTYDLQVLKRVPRAVGDDRTRPGVNKPSATSPQS